MVETVASPTYNIVCEYAASMGGREVPLFHIDAYRLGGEDDFDGAGAGECLGGDGVAIVEWSERVPGRIPLDALRVRAEVTGERSRVFHVWRGE